MNETFKTMTYKEFKDYCNKRACDGMWSIDEALASISIMEDIDSIKIKVFGIFHKKRTEQAQEKAWKKTISQL